MSIDLSKLEIQLKDNHDHTTAFLQTILETIDQIVQENKLQGEDIANNTKAIKLMEVDMEEMRRKLDKQEKSVENAAQSGAKQGAKETVPEAVDKGLRRIIEPAKRKYDLKRSRLSRLKFWRR